MDWLQRTQEKDARMFARSEMSTALSCSPPNFLTAVNLVQAFGADVLETRNAFDQTLLHLCARHNKPQYALLALERGANPSARDRMGWEPLRTCCSSRGANMEVAKALLLQGVDVDAVGPDGWRIIHSAAFFGFSEMILELLRAGADPNSRDRLEMTPLHLASSLGRLDAVKMLVECGADPTATDKKGLRALDVAVTSRNIAVAEYLENFVDK